MYESWLGDSGATTHITNNLAGMQNRKECAVNVTVSTGEVTTATTVGDVVLKTESGEKIKLLEVLYVPTLKRNLLSTNRFTDKGAQLFANSERMEIQKGKQKIILPMRKEGCTKMYVLKTTRVGTETFNDVAHGEKTEDVGVSTVPTLPKSMDINEAHGLCHLGEKLLRITFNALGVKLTGKLKACDGCCRANAKAKAVRKVTNTIAEKIGERLFVDTSGPYPETSAGNKYWICVVDDKTRKSWSEFRRTKSEIVKIVEKKIEDLKNMGHTVKYLRCDNAGEHQSKMTEMCKKYNIEMEYTAPYTPQMNGVVERRIAVLLNGARAAMYAANFNEETRKKLWAEAISYTETVRNSMATS